MLGIEGGLASGKSTVAGLLAERGARVIDADRIGHRILERPPVKKALVEAFGEGILDGAGRVSRPRLAEEAFSSRHKLAKLDQIVHPPLLEEIRTRVERLKKEDGVPLVVLDAALLVEWNLHEELCNALLFVDAPEQVRRRRAVSGRQMSAEQFHRRAQVQLPEGLRKQQADYVVQNTGDLAELEQEVETLWDEICGASPRHPA